MNDRCSTASMVFTHPVASFVDCKRAMDGDSIKLYNGFLQDISCLFKYSLPVLALP